MEGQDENNFEFLLSMEEDILYRWLATIPEEYLDYIETLLDNVEDRLDKIVMDTCSFKEVNEIIKHIKTL